MTHTPGPWKTNSGQVVRESDGAVIANMDRSDAASEAGIYPVERDDNARLIAAAPELLDALQYIPTEGSDCPPNVEPAEFYRSQLLACIGHAARAIAKAEGR